MTEQNDLDPPEPSKGDIVYATARAGLSSIPLVGAAAVELLQLLITPPLEKRRTQWMEEVAQTLQDLEQNRGVQLEDLQANDVFIDTVLHASQIALRNSQEEKRQALRNAILNAALPQAPEQSLQQMFLNFVDTFTVWHLRLLKLFHNPKAWFTANNKPFPNLYAGGLSHIVAAAYPGLDRSFYDQVWRDLYISGLTNTEGLHTMMTAQGLEAQRASDLGGQFLRFIEEP